MADPTLSGIKAFFEAHLRPGMVFIDIGANDGEVTAAAAAIVGASGRVFAYEPSPAVATALRARFDGHSEVEIREAAVADYVGHASFYVDPRTSTSSTLYAAASDADSTVVSVRVRTLDDEAARLPPVDLIKIDAQGADGRICEAARRLLKRDKPLLILEMWPDGLRAAGSDPTNVLNRLAGLGYHFHPLNTKGVLGHPDKIRALIAGQTRSRVINVVAHPRRWPSRRWQPALNEATCVVPRERRALCRPWLTEPDGQPKCP
jgi:FkbM family methyltransferase